MLKEAVDTISISNKLTVSISNKQKVIRLILDDKQKANVRNELVTLGNPPEEKALGVKWDTQNDTLAFT